MKPTHKITLAIAFTAVFGVIMPGHAGKKMNFLMLMNEAAKDEAAQNMVRQTAENLKASYQQKKSKLIIFEQAIKRGCINFKSSNKDGNLQTVLLKIASEPSEIMTNRLSSVQATEIALDELQKQLQNLTWNGDFSYYAQQTIRFLEKKQKLYHSKLEALQKLFLSAEAFSQASSSDQTPKTPATEISFYEQLQNGLHLEPKNYGFPRILSKYKTDEIDIPTNADPIKHILSFFIDILKKDIYGRSSEGLAAHFVSDLTQKATAFLPSAPESTLLNRAAMNAICQALTRDLHEYLAQQVKKWKDRAPVPEKRP